MILSLLTLLAFFCFGASSCIAMDDDRQDINSITIKVGTVPPQDDLNKAEPISNQQASNPLISNQHPLQQMEEPSLSFLGGGVKYMFGFLTEEEKEKWNQMYNPLYFNFDFGDAMKDLRV